MKAWKLISLMAAWLASGVAAAQAPQLQPVPEPGVVVLRNGQVISGQISRVGDFYYLTVPEGEIRLKAAEVEVACRDLEEGFQRKRTALIDNATEHLRLAQWCQKQGLLAHADEEIAEAKRLDPKHAMIPMLEQRQRLALEPPPTMDTATVVDRGVAQEELDRMVRQLPPGAAETFTQTIQPMLVNNCLTAGCHSPQAETKFHLLRTPYGQPAGRRLTQRNLYEALKWLDAERPEASPLIKAATTAHGGMKTPAFSEHQVSQQQRLTDWARLAGQRSGGDKLARGATTPKTAPQAAVATDAPSDKIPATEPKRLPMFDPAVRPASHSAPAATGSANNPHPRPLSHPLPAGGVVSSTESIAAGSERERGGPTQQTGSTTATSSPDFFKVPKDVAPLKPEMFDRSVKRGATIAPFVPADPFDPEAFNRRYFPKKDAAPASLPTVPLTKQIQERGE